MKKEVKKDKFNNCNKKNKITLNLNASRIKIN